MDEPQTEKKSPSTLGLVLLDLGSILAWIVVCLFLFWLWRG